MFSPPEPAGVPTWVRTPHLLPSRLLDSPRSSFCSVFWWNGRPSGPFLRFSCFHCSSLCSGSPQISLFPSVNLLFVSFLFRSPNHFFQIFFVQSFWCVEASFFHFFVFQPLREFSCADPFNVSDSLLKFRYCFVGFRFPFTFTLPIQPFKVFDLVFVSQRWKNQSWNMLLNTLEDFQSGV